MWSNLPSDVLVEIFSRLHVLDIAVVSRVCRNWHHASHSDTLWFLLYRRQWPLSGVADHKPGIKWMEEYRCNKLIHQRWISNSAYPRFYPLPDGRPVTDLATSHHDRNLFIVGCGARQFRIGDVRVHDRRKDTVFDLDTVSSPLRILPHHGNSTGGDESGVGQAEISAQSDMGERLCLQFIGDDALFIGYMHCMVRIDISDVHRPRVAWYHRFPGNTTAVDYSVYNVDIAVLCREDAHSHNANGDDDDDDDDDDGDTDSKEYTSHVRLYDNILGKYITSSPLSPTLQIQQVQYPLQYSHLSLAPVPGAKVRQLPGLLTIATYYEQTEGHRPERRTVVVLWQPVHANPYPEGCAAVSSSAYHLSHSQTYDMQAKRVILSPDASHIALVATDRVRVLSLQPQSPLDLVYMSPLLSMSPQAAWSATGLLLCGFRLPGPVIVVVSRQKVWCSSCRTQSLSLQERLACSSCHWSTQTKSLLCPGLPQVFAVSQTFVACHSPDKGLAVLSFSPD